MQIIKMLKSSGSLIEGDHYACHNNSPNSSSYYFNWFVDEAGNLISGSSLNFDDYVAVPGISHDIYNPNIGNSNNNQDWFDVIQELQNINMNMVNANCKVNMPDPNIGLALTDISIMLSMMQSDRKSEIDAAVSIAVGEVKQEYQEKFHNMGGTMFHMNENGDKKE